MTQRPIYKDSAETSSAKEKLQTWEQSAPEAYSSKYTQQIEELLASILNRPSFSYDAESDPLYNAYKDSYVQLGKMAMEDTVGRASALTGGYGNSYATAAGSAAYQSYLAKLTDKIPSLWQAAYSRYADEGERMNENLQLLQNLDASDYNVYRDTVDDYFETGSYLQKRLDSLTKADRESYNAAVKDYEYEREAAEEIRRYEMEMAYKAEQNRIEQERWEKEYALSLLKAQTAARSASNSGASQSASDSSSDLAGGKTKGEKGYLSYDKLGSAAKKWADLIKNPQSYVGGKDIKPSIKEGVESAYKNGKISKDEYEALKNLMETEAPGAIYLQ